MSVTTRFLIVFACLILVPSQVLAETKVWKLAEKCGKGKQEACQELVQIAKADPDPARRAQAVGDLTDQTVLVSVASNDQVASVRKRALSRLDNHTVFSTGLTSETLAQIGRIAVTDSSVEVRLAAVLLVSDQALLARIAIDDSSGDVRNAAIAKIADQPSLSKVALSAQDPAGRAAALQRISDPSILTQLALATTDPKLGVETVQKLTDQASLVTLVTSCKLPEVRAAAASNIEDQALLARLAQSDPDERVRAAADGAKRRTVQAAKEVYLWKAPSGSENARTDAHPAQWTIRGIFRKADINLPAALTGPLGEQAKTIDNLFVGGADFMTEIDSSSHPEAQGFVPWWIAPKDRNSVLTLDAGSLSISSGAGIEAEAGKDLASVLKFDPVLDNGKSIWLAGGAGDKSLGFITFMPRLHINMNGRLALGGGLFAYLLQPVPGSNSNVFQATNLTAQDAPVTVRGEILFPADSWTVVGPGLKIRGGGLELDDTGVYLSPGTEYRRF